MKTNSHPNSLGKFSAALVSLLVFTALALASCQPAATPPPTATRPASTATKPAPTATPEAMMKPEVEVKDQEIKDSSVVIAKVVSDGPGWLVIHAQAEGKPGPVIGYAPVKSGENKDVVVKIDESKATETLYAMLHVDAGTVGTYEFPGADVPAAVDGQVITPAFKAMQASAGGYSSESEPGVTIKTATNSQLGTFLVDQDGMTLYLFTKDEPDKSNCTGSCLDAWPPLITSGEPKAGEGVDAAKLGFIVLADGRKQVTYDRMPLYYYAPDQKPGDVLGQGVGGVWFVVKP